MRVVTKEITIIGQILKASQYLPTWQKTKMKIVYNRFGCIVAKYIHYAYQDKDAYENKIEYPQFTSDLTSREYMDKLKFWEKQRKYHYDWIRIK